MARIYTWEIWISKGFKDDDLNSVLWLLKEKIKQRRKTVTCFRFSTLIGNTEWFEEDLEEAKALKRGPARCFSKESVLRATGRTEQIKETVRSAADILAGMKAFEEFRALKEAL